MIVKIYFMPYILIDHNCLAEFDIKELTYDKDNLSM